MESKTSTKRHVGLSAVDSALSDGKVAHRNKERGCVGRANGSDILESEKGGGKEVGEEKENE